MRIENEFQNFSTITIVAQYSNSIYVRNVNKSSFKTYCMRQNDVLFAKIRSCRMNLRQLTCFRCIVKIVFESASQSVNQSNQLALVEFEISTRFYQ